MQHLCSKLWRHNLTDPALPRSRFLCLGLFHVLLPLRGTYCMCSNSSWSERLQPPVFHTWPLSHLFPRRAVRRAPVAKLTLDALYFDWIKQFSTTCPVNIWRGHLVPTKQGFKKIERKFGRVWTRGLGTTQHLCIPTVPHTGLWVCLVAKPTSLRIRNVLEPCEQMIKTKVRSLRSGQFKSEYIYSKQNKPAI